MTLTLLNIPHFDHPNLGYIKDIYKNTKLKKIVNVYQKNYINAKGFGFGDFLRGSIYLTYVCMVLGLEFDIDIKSSVSLLVIYVKLLLLLSNSSIIISLLIVFGNKPAL